MEAIELRIGNFVNSSFKVTAIDSAYVRTVNIYGNPVGLLTNEVHPIPLTEEILLKCGFEFDSVYISYNNGYFTLIYNEGHISLVVEGQWLTLEIKYLHQLQNLYFALTGEELEVTL